MHAEEGEFDQCLGCLIVPGLTELASELDDLAFLGSRERAAVVAGVTETLVDTLRRRVSRLLVVELNLAADNGTLSGATPADRWTEFLDWASQPGFWRDLSTHYPTLLARLDTTVANRCAAGAEFARRFGADRAAIDTLLGHSGGELTAVGFGQGDTHRAGRSVARLSLDNGALIYKPRSLAVDAALDRFLEVVFDPHGSLGRGGVDQQARIRVPRVLARPGYGWSEFIEHRYCRTPEELSSYYTGIGHWLAIARLFGTTDLHAENVIAAGPGPVIVDCETLFTPWLRLASMGMGDATDRALQRLYSTVLLSGLLPGRGSELGWRGVDISAIGALPGQQPEIPMLRIVDAGTDKARMASQRVPVAATANLPSPEPVLERHWPDLLAGFDALTTRLAELDEVGVLEPAMAGFAGVEVRGVLRATESYAELTRMLWHPVSLHDEAAAVARAAQLLTEQGRARPSAPSDPVVVAAEVAELLHGDIPLFATTTSDGQLTGPAGSRWGEPHDLVDAALTSWRSADLATERGLIRTSPISAYSGEGWQPEGARLSVAEVTGQDLSSRIGRLVESLLATLESSAVRGSDGTVTWIAPVLNTTGWSVQPLSLDSYSGAAGVALLLAGYRRASESGQLAPLGELEELLAGTVQTMRAAFDRTLEIRSSSRFLGRPKSPGLYVGLGSQIWSWLWLVQLGAVKADELSRAVTLAGMLPQAVEAAEDCDVLAGTAGSIVALLMLAEQTRDGRWIELAETIGDTLVRTASRSDGTAYWPSPRAPQGLGGFVHGSAGIGWALARLSLVTGHAPFAETAEAAFAFDEMLYQPAIGDWQDLRGVAAPAPAWCHGAGGIGLAAADLIRLGFGDRQVHEEVVRRAAAACWTGGMGFNHSLCHGDLGCWELLDTAFGLGLAPSGLHREEVAAYLIGSIEEHGPVSGVARQAFSPGLLPGLSGIAYQLLRMNPECELGSVLVPELALASADATA
jgi:type 2 lantibiotic biosynthesis protein LanM